VVSHPGDHVGIGVERDRHGGVAQELLDVFGVDVSEQKQRRARVPEIMKANHRETSALQQRCEGTLSQVSWVYRSSYLGGKDESLVLVEVAKALYVLKLAL
jgi:hypothetical protein